jgi:hypothetical protein
MVGHDHEPRAGGTVITFGGRLWRRGVDPDIVERGSGGARPPRRRCRP